MYLSSETDKMVHLLSENERLAEVYVIKAYPFAYKPTMLKQPIVCVSPGGLNARHSSLGQSRFAGDYKINIDVFVPHSFGSPAASETLEAVLEVVFGTNANKVELGEIKSADELDCFTAKCTASYQSQIWFSEGTLWTQQN